MHISILFTLDIPVSNTSLHNFQIHQQVLTSCCLEWFKITIFSKYFTEGRKKKRQHLLLGHRRINKKWLKDKANNAHYHVNCIIWCSTDVIKVTVTSNQNCRMWILYKRAERHLSDLNNLQSIITEKEKKSQSQLPQQNLSTHSSCLGMKQDTLPQLSEQIMLYITGYLAYLDHQTSFLQPYIALFHFLRGISTSSLNWWNFAPFLPVRDLQLVASEKTRISIGVSMPPNSCPLIHMSNSLMR